MFEVIAAIGACLFVGPRLPSPVGFVQPAGLYARGYLCSIPRRVAPGENARGVAASEDGARVTRGTSQPSRAMQHAALARTSGDQKRVRQRRRDKAQGRALNGSLSTLQRVAPVPINLARGRNRNPCVRCSSTCATQPAVRLTIHSAVAEPSGIPNARVSTTKATATPGCA